MALSSGQKSIFFSRCSKCLFLEGGPSSLDDREDAGERERDGLGEEQHPGWRAKPGISWEYGTHKTVEDLSFSEKSLLFF